MLVSCVRIFSSLTGWRNLCHCVFDRWRDLGMPYSASFRSAMTFEELVREGGEYMWQLSILLLLRVDNLDPGGPTKSSTQRTEPVSNENRASVTTKQ
jgi:hypothetical protein